MFRSNFLRLGAIVYLLPAIVIAPDGFRRVTSPTADGTFSIVDLPSGTYVVKYSEPGF
jgi:hypothetical protein